MAIVQFHGTQVDYARIVRCAALVAMFFLVLPRAAEAAGTARLVYLRGQGAESCPDDVAMRDAVAARLGYDPFTPFALDTLFTEIDKEGSGFVARVKLVGNDGAVRGARTLGTTGACSELTTTLALTISLAIDPMAFARKGPPEGLPPSERPVDTTTPPTDETSPPPPDETPPPPPAPRERVRFGGGAGVVGAAGAEPGPGLGFFVFADARYGAFGGVLEGRADLPSSADAGGARVSSSLLALSLLPCAYSGFVFACARGALGRLSAEGLDVTQPGTSSALWAAAGARIGGDFPLGAVLRVRLHVGTDAVLTRYDLRIGGFPVFRTAPLAGDLGLALGATLP